MVCDRIYLIEFLEALGRWLGDAGFQCTVVLVDTVECSGLSRLIPSLLSAMYLRQDALIEFYGSIRVMTESSMLQCTVVLVVGTAECTRNGFQILYSAFSGKMNGGVRAALGTDDWKACSNGKTS